MQVRNYLGAFGVIGVFNLALAVALVVIYQSGYYDAYNGKPGINWDGVWANFGGLFSFLWFVGGIILVAVFGTVAGILAHRQNVPGAVIFAMLLLVVGVLMGIFVNWEHFDWPGIWSIFWPLLVLVGVTALETFLALLVYELLRRP